MKSRQVWGAVRRSRNFFQLREDDPNSFVRRNAPAGSALRRYTVQGREMTTMFGDELQRVSQMKRLFITTHKIYGYEEMLRLRFHQIRYWIIL